MSLVQTPETTLTARFSDPSAAATSWEATSNVLEEAQLFWISTVRADGRPHVTPLVAVWDDDALWFCTGATEQKAVNLRANPRVVLTTGCSTWDRGLDVVLEGEAVPVTDDAVLTRLAAKWAAKWDGRWQWQVGDGAFHNAAWNAQALVFEVRPDKVFAHAKGDPFGETRHRF